MLKVGIVGLPNVGKSTLFNALLKKQVAEAANYPFCTIEPNIGVIEVPDERLGVLAKLVGTEKIVPSAVEFYDIAGLVKGASEGEGLGNKFLSHIRETALIAHVVRLFEDSEITHVDAHPDPIRDINTIDTELLLADIAVLSKQREPKGSAPKEEKFTWEVIQKVLPKMDAGMALRDILSQLSEEEIEALRQFNLLTSKPVLYVFNLSENQLMDEQNTTTKIHGILEELAKSRSNQPSAQSHSSTIGSTTNLEQTTQSYIALCVKLEQEVCVLEPDEQLEYLAQFNLHEPGLNRLIKKAYALLGLISYLTAGVQEARAWPITAGTKAPQAAGVIHTDFEKHFIKAEIVNYDDFVEAGSWTKARETGKVILGGKEYVMKDGDVVDFKIGV